MSSKSRELQIWFWQTTHHTQMSTPDTAGLDETAEQDRCPNHRRSRCQYEHGIYSLRALAKYTCNDTTYEYQLHWNITPARHQFHLSYTASQGCGVGVMWSRSQSPPESGFWPTVGAHPTPWLYTEPSTTRFSRCAVLVHYCAPYIKRI